ncbi:MAG: hypothetical protein ACTTKH_07065, partial [Treponema sp.]
VALVLAGCRQGAGSKTGEDDDDDSSGGGTNNSVTFRVDVYDIKPIAAKCVIEPSDDTVTYAFGIMTKKKYEDAIDRTTKDGKDPKLAAFYHDKSWSEFQKKNYGFPTWQAAAKKDGYYKQGKQDVDNVVSSGYIYKGDIAPETECLVYWYLIKETSEVPESEIFIKPFKTTAVTPSTNVLNLTVTKAYKNGVDVSVTATNDDIYTIVIGTKKNLEWYLASNKYNLTDWAKKIVADFEGSAENAKVPLFHGAGTKNIDHSAFKGFLQDNTPSGSEFSILYFVYEPETGIRSDVKHVEFTTTSEPASY